MSLHTHPVKITISCLPMAPLVFTGDSVIHAVYWYSSDSPVTHTTNQETPLRVLHSLRLNSGLPAKITILCLPMAPFVFTGESGLQAVYWYSSDSPLTHTTNQQTPFRVQHSL